MRSEQESDVFVVQPSRQSGITILNVILLHNTQITTKKQRNPYRKHMFIRSLETISFKNRNSIRHILLLYTQTITQQVPVSPNAIGL
jgi:hypothetical protein